MSGNTYGKLFKVTTFGETHGSALGCVIDGCPAGIPIIEDYIQQELNRRRPGNHGDKKNAAVTPRKEADEVEILSGTFEGLSTGTPISLLIRNENQNSKDYSHLEHVFRPGHADYTFYKKYGIRDYRGGGRSSGRETAARVAAGAVAKLALSTICENPIEIIAYTKEACGIKASEVKTLTSGMIESNAMRTTDTEISDKMLKKIEELQQQGDSTGAIIECIIKNVPAGLGETVFDKIDAELAKAMLSIGAVKGIEFGKGFESAKMTGSEWNDAMEVNEEGNPTFLTNNAGGILGGMSNGNDIIFRIAVKPVPSISKEQKTIKKCENGTYENTTIEVKGRHDVCLAPRIVPVVEAMAALVLADLLLRNRASK